MEPKFQRGDIFCVACKVIECLADAQEYALYRLEEGRWGAYVAATTVAAWLQQGYARRKFIVSQGHKFEKGYLFLTERGEKLFTPVHGPFPEDKDQVSGFCRAFKRFATAFAKDKYPNMLYFHQYDLLLPLPSAEEMLLSGQELIGRWISDGLPVDAGDTELAEMACRWSKEFYNELLELAGIEKTQTSKRKKTKAKKGDKGSNEPLPLAGEFVLKGREGLTNFFNEYIIDFFKKPQEYRRMGIESLPAVLMYGPPGSGKTYAVEQLAKYLDIPVFEINSNTVASVYIHGTSQKVAEVFQKAINNAPSLLVIDEIEAYLSSRTESSHEHHVEEVDEFLRNIPKAIEAQVLIFGMTNYPQLLDKAILRKGRFDHQLEVGMPSKEEVQAVLEAGFADRPVEADIDYAQYAQSLAGRPLADVAFIIRESARMTVREGSSSITKEIIGKVIQKLLTTAIVGSAPKKKKIGF